jgi:hypothetical protein
MTGRSRAIIAVFGGDEREAVDRASAFGEAIAKKGHILLTGGDGSNTATVKDQAIEGARPSAWVGVDPDPGPDRKRPIDAELVRDGFVVKSALGHWRNYLEGFLCDAAIGLPGGAGTLSEVMFALSLQRPVAFVGDDWKNKWDVDNTYEPEVLDDAFDRVRKSGDKPGFDEFLERADIQRALQRLPPHEYFAQDTPSGDVVDWIRSSISTPYRGAFPPLKGYEDVIGKYESWLKEQQPA